MKIIITGGASGLGEAITRLIAVTIHDCEILITFNNSNTNALLLKSVFKNVHIQKCDFCESDEVAAFVTRIIDFNPDVLINNGYSGPFLSKHFHKSSSNEFIASFEQNIIPLIDITRQSILCFRKKKFGKIINISTAALVGKPPVGASEYTANKAYIEALSRSWATENIAFNITSNCISPSIMATTLTAKMDARLIEDIVTKHPLKKLLTVYEVAETVLFFLRSPQHINGIVLPMNAGTDLR